MYMKISKFYEQIIIKIIFLIFLVYSRYMYAYEGNSDFYFCCFNFVHSVTNPSIYVHQTIVGPDLTALV